MDFKEKLDKAAENHLDLLAEYADEYPDMADVKNAFKMGVRWLMKQPLPERLNPDERERMKAVYSALSEGLDCCHDEHFYDSMEYIEKIFGKELFEHK